METTRLSTKGQLILPKSIRDRESLRPGTRFTVRTQGDEIILKPVKPSPTSTIEEVMNALPKQKRKRLTEKQWADAIAREVKRRHALGRY
jgi:AbrB family looped-hinge helix DNA binding protein